jgi:succinyl-CoA synthetase beta subunit/citryl-CoA synthetase large subunit
MRLLEHESKSLLGEYGLETPRGRLAGSPVEAADAVRRLGCPSVLKSQIPAGGRGKAGGLAFVSTPEEAVPAAQALLSQPLRGYDVNHLLVEERVQIERELFLSITYDTHAKRAVLLASHSGGVDIESESDKVRRYSISLRRSWPTYRSREIAADLGLGGRPLLALTGIVDRLVRVFVELDAVLAEINPLALTGEGRLLAVDAHLELDDEAISRHQDLVDRFGLSGRGSRPLTDFERKARDIDSADHRGVAGRVVEFDGDLGLIIGGGGASLTAFDAVLDAGLKPANYCEVGGNPSVWKVQELTKLLLKQPRVDKIAVISNVVSNTRVDLVARGLIKGILQSGRDPAQTVVAFRMPGSWEDEGFVILRRYGVPFHTREVSIDQVVDKIIEGTG